MIELPILYRLACVDDALAMAELVDMAGGRMAGQTLRVRESWNGKARTSWVFFLGDLFVY